LIEHVRARARRSETSGSETGDERPALHKLSRVLRKQT
jgi:hypothetical protein